jgi:hypothetical protein
MSDTVTVALISAGSSMLVAITALILNYRGFASIDARFVSLEASINTRFASVDARFASIERRLEVIEADIKQFYRMLAEHAKRITGLEDKQ